MKLNQLLAIEKGIKNSTYSRLTDLFKAAQKKELYDGRARHYQPKDDDGERFPDESQSIQLHSRKVLEEVHELRGDYFDIVFQKDVTNLEARADVAVDGKIIISQAPVTTLLFLEKELKDIETFVSRMPVLDPSETWSWNDGQDAHASEPVETAKTKKVLKAVTLYEATDHHPAQVQSYTEDVVAGYWTTIKYSAALTQTRKREILSRVRKLQNAVKMAREEANQATVISKQQIGDSIFGYLLG